MHDINNLEQRGIPSMFIASSEFVQAADAQSHALGYTPHAVFVPHPIQDRTDDEVRAIADDALEAVLEKIGANS